MIKSEIYIVNAIYISSYCLLPVISIYCQIKEKDYMKVL